MTATNTSKPAKDGGGTAFTIEMASESISGNIAQKTYIGSPSTEGLVEPPTHADVTAITAALGSPMQATGGTVGLVAGSAIIGKTGIDQTIPGTTNAVVVTGTVPLPTGAATAAGLTTINTTLGTPAQDGADGTGITPPAGAAGIRGWLSGIFNKLNTSIGVTGTFWQATQPISAASLPLPSGAATSAKQPALGTAGAASADVISVQGIAGATAVKVDGSAVIQPVSGAVTANAGTNLNTSALALEAGGNLAMIAGGLVAQGSTTAGQKGGLELGAVTTAAPAYTTGQTSPLSLDTSGNLRVVTSGGGSNGFVAQGSPTGGEAGPLIQGAVTTAAPAYTTAQTSPLSLDTAGNLRVNVVSGGVNAALVAGTSIIGKVGIDQTTPGTTNAVVVTGTVPLPAGAAIAANQPTAAAQGSATSGQTGRLMQGAVTTAAPAYTAAQTSPLSLDTAGNLRVNVAAGGAVGGTSSSFAAAFPAAGTAMGAKNGANMVNLAADASGNLQMVAAPSGASSNGLSHFQTTTSATNFVLKSSAGSLYDCYVQSSISVFLMIFDATSVPSDGTVTPVHVIQVAANQSVGVDAGRFPEVYTTGISMCVSTTGGYTKTTPGSGVFFFHGRGQ